jgi:hypothetical protein
MQQINNQNYQESVIFFARGNDNRGRLMMTTKAVKEKKNTAREA